ncbi:MAG: type III-B CRISPR-associated protein Cas10/Cmr2 [Phycisphaerae bacterium]|jgi:CRISPR-associated protein Cmr2|nr:MAG: type III-B CRISPR-associated protein Cas10/Cmr2 [Phycisphaerae bacterium]
MSHLLTISVGPVQEFIAAARRTRDLWFGSYLLSEISRAVAKSVEADGGKLIFPASSDAENVANVILAELPSGEPRDVAAKAKQAAQDCWKRFVDDAWQQASGVIRQDIWNDQKDDVIEFYAAWVQQTGDYKADRGKLMRLLAGRKNCRDFLPAKGRAGVPKSSLDGQRESVLKDPARERWPERFRARLRLREGEQLDIVGLVKRVAGGNRSYPSVSRVACDPWIRGNIGKQAFSDLIKACQELPPTVLHRLDGEVFQQFKDFPYEGTAVYVSRHHEWEQEVDEEDRLSIADIQDALERLSQPNPYLAVLVADGDKMGAAISALGSADAHREFSNTLAGFANSARTIVNDHSGVLVYAGGDDVLAFLPVDKCLSCARKLHDDFGKRLAKYGNPTLSVGIAIGHFMENLEDLLDYGRAAEKAAKKPDRDGLAVHLHKRGGAPVVVRSKWSGNPDQRLERFANLMNDGIIPTRLPYELQTMATLYKNWNTDVADAIQQDLYRVISRKTSRGSGTVKAALSDFIDAMDADKLMHLAHEFLVARQIAESLRQASIQKFKAKEVRV